MDIQGRYHFFHFTGEITTIQKDSVATPLLPISRYTITVASQLLSEFEMKASIYLYAASCLPLPYKNVHWNKDCVFCILYCIQITLKMFAE